MVAIHGSGHCALPLLEGRERQGWPMKQHSSSPIELPFSGRSRRLTVRATRRVNGASCPVAAFARRHGEIALPRRMSRIALALRYPESWEIVDRYTAIVTVGRYGTVIGPTPASQSSPDQPFNVRRESRARLVRDSPLDKKENGLPYVEPAAAWCCLFAENAAEVNTSHPQHLMRSPNSQSAQWALPDNV
ncbi:hypothetical protein OKW41_003150 [Paraburkholderia sp. UCT70]